MPPPPLPLATDLATIEAGASWPVMVALRAALVADSILAPVLGARWYSAQAPRDAVLPYGVFVSPDAAGGLFLAEPSTDAGGQLDIYSAQFGYDEVLALCAHVVRVLESALLPLPNGTGGTSSAVVAAITARVVAAFVEPDHTTMHGVIRYSATVIAPAS